MMFLVEISSTIESRFDGATYYRALEATVLAKKLRWKDVSAETGISTSTSSRRCAKRCCAW